jgi:DNA processing protein
LSAEEQSVVQVLKSNNDLNLNILAVQAGLSVSRLTAVLFELEMKGVVRSLAGGTYHLI